jgi:predicted deacylase
MDNDQTIKASGHNGSVGGDQDQQAVLAGEIQCPHRVVGHFGSQERSMTTLVIIGGVHGNEPAGLYAAKRVLNTLREEQPTQFNGRLVVLAGNLAALGHRNQATRYIDHDLNRLFTDEEIAKPATTSVEHAQMQELLVELRSIRAHCERMIVMDLHTTSSDTPPVMVFEDSIRARRFARQMPMPIYLGFEEELGGLVVDRVTNEMDSIGIVVEGGQHEDSNSIDVLESVIWAGLHSSGVLNVDAIRHREKPGDLLRASVGEEAYKVYDIRYLHTIEHASFKICDNITAGLKIKRDQTPIAIEQGNVITSSQRGRVFLPNMQQHKRVGDDGFFIVRHVGEGWLGLSARLRNQQWIHWMIARMPGVYQMEDHSLCIDSDIAAVLKRQVFHIFGYRMIRHDRRDAGHGLTRARRGVSAFVRAFLRGPIKGGPDMNDPRFWVVRRHKLDL